MLKLPKIITKSLSIRLSLMVIFAIALLLSLSLGVMFYFSRQALKQEALQNASQTLEGTVQHIDNILLSVEQSAGNIYYDLLQHLDEPDRMFTYSRKLVESNPYIVGCAIVFKPNYYPDHELFIAYVHRKGNSVMTTEESDLVVSDTFGDRPYTEQEWYTMPMATQRAYWTDPVKNDDSKDDAVTSFCLPFYDNKEQCVGVLAADVSVGLLSQIVLAAKPSPNGYTVLLGRNGSYIVHPDPNTLLHQTVFTQTGYNAEHSVKEAADAMIAGETGYKHFRLDGHDNYVFYKPFKRTEVPGRTQENTGWSVGVVYPEGDIFGEYNLLLYDVLAIAIIGLLLFFVLCRLVTRRQLKPLQLLTHSAQRIADGNYDETIPATRREDEIGQLQDHFQQMQQSLAANINELEQLTATLQERSEGLHKMYQQARKADSMKTTFLHNMTNQMMTPAETVDQSVTTLCDNYRNISWQEADHEVETIRQQTKTMTNLLNHLLEVSDNDIRKEGAHE